MGDDEDGQTLWQYITKHIKPLDRQDVYNDFDDWPGPAPVQKKKRVSELPEKEEVITAPPIQGKKAAPIEKPYAGAGLDRRTAEKLKRGQMPIDGKIDLHGYTQEQAYTALRDYIKAAYNQDKRCLLVISGKGRAGGEGILKRRVPEWLCDPAIAPSILRFCPARPRHGGSGALYVLLRRNRDRH